MDHGCSIWDYVTKCSPLFYILFLEIIFLLILHLVCIAFIYGTLGNQVVTSMVKRIESYKTINDTLTA